MVSNNTLDYRLCSPGAPAKSSSARNLEHLSDQDLLASILKPTRASQTVIDKLKKAIGSLTAKDLNDMDIDDISQKLELTSHQTDLISAVLEFARRAYSVCQMALNTPEATMCYIGDMGNLNKEHFRALFLDTRKQLIKMETISIGDLSSSIAHPREIFQPAIQCLADSLIVAHNHPSGDPHPSDADIKLTNRLRRAGELLGIKLIDHIIVGSSCYISLRRQGILRD